jgi:hypothetical protein
MTCASHGVDLGGKFAQKVKFSIPPFDRGFGLFAPSVMLLKLVNQLGIA